MKEYRVIIAGSREFSDYEKLKENCDRILQEKLEQLSHKEGGVVSPIKNRIVRTNLVVRGTTK